MQYYKYIVQFGQPETTIVYYTKITNPVEIISVETTMLSASTTINIFHNNDFYRLLELGHFPKWTIDELEYDRIKKRL